MEQGLVSVVLVTWNSAEHLPRCLDGLRRQTHGSVELIAVDNASSDASVSLVAPHAARVIRNETNRGFSAAVNQAIAVARGTFVMFLNPDCFLEPGYIARLVAALEKAGPAFGSATGKLLKADGSGIDSMGIRMTRSGRHLDIADELAVGGEVFGVSGAAALHRAAFLSDAAVEGEVLDEDFFAYREDADLAWRGRLFGWRALCEPSAVAYHVRTVTPEGRKQVSAEVNMHSVKNRFLLRLENEGLYLAMRNAPFELFRDLVVIAATLLMERSSLPAFSWLWRNRARILAKRRAIQSRRKVSDRELARWFR